MSDKMREMFEKWAAEHYWLREFGPEREAEEYFDAEVQTAWEAWQAALAQQPAPAAPVAQEPAACCPYCAGSSGRCDTSFPHPPAAEQPATAVPEGFLLVTPEQLERHTTTAWECPPQSRVVLVSSIKRLHDKNAAAAAPAAPAAQEPVAWRYTSSQAFRRKDRRWHYQETFPHAENRSVQEIGLLEPLYTTPPAAEQPDTVAVPRELLEELADIADAMQCHDARDDAIALLGKEGEA